MLRKPIFIIAVTLILSACSSQTAPERTVRRFFRAVNDKDVNRMLTCVDPRQERMFRATFRVLEKATGFPMTDLLELLPGLNQALGAHMAEEIRYSNIRVIAKEITETEAKLTISVRATSRFSGGVREQTAEVEFFLENFEDDGWRIVGARSRPLSHAGADHSFLMTITALGAPVCRVGKRARVSAPAVSMIV